MTLDQQNKTEHLCGRLYLRGFIVLLCKDEGLVVICFGMPLLLAASIVDSGLHQATTTTRLAGWQSTCFGHRADAIRE